MSTAPYVELGFNPTDLRPRDLPRAGAFLGSPAEAIQAALAVARLSMVTQMKEEVRGLVEPTSAQLLTMADLAWQAVFWKYRKISAPVIADAYVRAYRAADAGDVPMSVVYDLADKHAEKIGDYFHVSSRDALADGFNTMVNRRIPAKAAADRVLDAYGLTPRQMRGYTSAKQLQVPVDSVMPFDVKAKTRAYIDRSFTTRVKKLSEQEEHNIDEQAKQFAWMWLQDKGSLTERAQKMWITAHDERVCPICGPLHGQKVLVGEQFVTKEGSFWTPGLHPNCRCVVRLIENLHTITKADVWDAREHPRGGAINPGRFRRVLEKEKIPLAPIWATLDQPVETEVEEPVETPVEPLGSSVKGMLGSSVSRMTVGRAAPLGSGTEPTALGSSVPKLGVSAVHTPLGSSAKVVPLGGGVEPVPIGQGLVLPKLGVSPALARPKAKPDLAPYAKTRPLHADGRPFWTVIHESDYDSDMTLNKSRFSDSMSDVMSIATEMREQKVDEILDIVLGSHRNKTVHVTGTDEETGGTMYGEVSPQMYEYALKTIALEQRRDRELDQLPAADNYEDVIWTDSVGHRVAEDQSYISFADLVEQSGVGPQEFVYRVLETNHGHNDENATRLIGQHKFDLSGQYVEAGPTTMSFDNEGKEIPVTLIKPY